MDLTPLLLISRKKPFGSKKRSGGRNSQGKMTMRYKGGGHKKRYRIIDFKRNKTGIPAEVKSIEYDPNRTAFIALLNYQDGEKRYIIAQNGLKVGQKLLSGNDKCSPRSWKCYAFESNSFGNNHFLY